MIITIVTRNEDGNLVRSSVVRPPLRWAGSKRALLPKLIAELPSEFEKYYEPFFGSGCLYFSIRPKQAKVGDFNPDLIDFYAALRDAPDAVVSAFLRLPISDAEYYELRAKNPANMEAADRAARFLYLNRYSFNGVYRTNRSGQFNVPVGKKAGAPPSRTELLAAAHALGLTKLSNADYKETLRDVRQGDFVYLDPPYVNPLRKGYGEYGYGSFGAEGDMLQLNNELLRLHHLGAKVLFSFGSAMGLETALDGWEVMSVSPRQSVASSSSARKHNPTEILARNYIA